jgi:NAD(P)-dependent dehydrogenase (short-subunit alcohol dehydrogenase family)
MNAQKIEGTIALVTGANRGIGRALTEALITRGAARVYATARDPKTLSDLHDARIVSLQLDVTQPNQISAVAEAIGDVQLVISNAGVALASGFARSNDVDDARREMEVNYFGPLQLIQQLAPTLAKNGGGALVTIGSIAGLTNMPMMPTYSASKGALHSLTQAARALLAAQNTAVFGVYAGPVDTDMSRALQFPKALPRDVAAAILDGVESGEPDIFPDAFAADFGRQFEASPKTVERQLGAMLSSLAA